MGRKQKRGEEVSQFALRASEPTKAVCQWIYVLCSSCSHSAECCLLLHIHHSTSKCSSTATRETFFPAAAQVLSHLLSLCPNFLCSVPVTLRRLSVAFLACQGQKGGPIVTENKGNRNSKYWKLLSLKKLLKYLGHQKKLTNFLLFCRALQNIHIGLISIYSYLQFFQNILVLWKTDEFSVCLPKYKISILRT